MECTCTVGTAPPQACASYAAFGTSDGNRCRDAFNDHGCCKPGS